MTPDPKFMSIDGLYDACIGSASAMIEEAELSERIAHRRWLMRYVAELKRRALRAEHDVAMLRIKAAAHD